ncbi:C40 family peptidase [Brachybacterium phenoliresistens]|uniref:Hydrolase n=1 Tax=Brachybacterium phenoliresistens TaxID=396014 RepID=Z9JX26_9MICO|nr:NlpC/P60 family protein [Brachybacterium phenoliresistens]EWS82749.1 hydrolase [Brachybacterium phenoliresistens]
MAKHSTHRVPGRATYGATRLAFRGLGGAAMLGTVVIGSAFAAQSATAAPAAETAAPAEISAVAPAHPVATANQLTADGGTLYEGVRGDRVATLQTMLNTHGADLEVDGSFGPLTLAAVLDYQESNGLQVDGRVGPETRGSLNGGSAEVSASAGTAVATSSEESSSSSGQAILDAARSQIGVHYSWGGESASTGFDCSGLTQYAYAQAGIDLPRTSSAQASAGTQISQSEAQVGDLVVWPGHIGIYAGDNTVVDAGSSKGSVSERTIWGDPTFVTYR